MHYTFTLNNTCKHCERDLALEDGRWIDPEADGDDSLWREVCDANDETRAAEHEATWTLTLKTPQALLEVSAATRSEALRKMAGEIDSVCAACGYYGDSCPSDDIVCCECAHYGTEH